MKHYIFIFKECALFEVVLLANFLSSQNEQVVIVGEEETVKAHEGFKIQVDMLLKDIDKETIKSFTITGGNPSSLVDKVSLKSLLLKLQNNSDVLIGAICGGVYIISELLEIDFNKINRPDVFLYENILLSPPNKYVDFAIQMLKEMNLYKNEEDYLETVRFFKEFKAE